MDNKLNRIIEEIERSADYVYHVAPAANVEAIAGEGIVAGIGATFAGGATRNYSNGWNFFTEAAGVIFWFSRVRDHIEYAYEPDDHAIYFPVLLRIPMFAISNLQDDESGSNDARAKAYKTQDSVDPEDIEYWNGSAWLPVEDFSSADELERGGIASSEWVSEETYDDDGAENGYEHVTFHFPYGWV